MSEEKPAPGTKCCERTWPAGSYCSCDCWASAKVIRDGKPYCGRHDPLKVKAQREKRNAEWNARREAEKAARAKAEAERAERERRAACFDDLLMALEHVAKSLYVNDYGEFALYSSFDAAPIDAAIAKARGE